MIGRELVYSAWYGRWHQQVVKSRIMNCWHPRKTGFMLSSSPETQSSLKKSSIVVVQCNTRWRACINFIQIVTNPWICHAQNYLMAGCHALEKYATIFWGSVVSIVLPNHPFVQVLAVFLNHIEKLLGKLIIVIFLTKLSYDQIKNLVPKKRYKVCVLSIP